MKNEKSKKRAKKEKMKKGANLQTSDNDVQPNWDLYMYI